MKVFNHRIKAFTLIELVIVVTMIGILMMATTIYLGGFDEKSKIIDGQGCARSIGGEINNFLFYTLTSKNLRLSSSDKPESPSYYIIEFTGGNGSNCTSGNMCDKINLAFTTGINADNNIKLYKTLSVGNTCQQNRQPIRFYRSGAENNGYIIMNKGFIPKEVSNRDVFYINANGSKIKTGDVIVGLCLNSDCSSPKEIAKFAVDARSQTITTKNCRFYQDTDPTKCRVREGEKDEGN